MRILVTGASGLLGRRVYATLKGLGSHDVIGTCFTRSEQHNFTKLDLTKLDQLTQLFNESKPEAVIHCAAERRPDVVENKTSDAEALNVTGTQMICDLAKKTNCWVLYISTDYVFDGTKAPYMVDDKPNPLNKYGMMKLAGEKCVLATHPDNAVLRVPILYGPVEFVSESAVTVLYSKVKDTSMACTMDHRQRRFPTHTDNVADIIQQMIVRQTEKPHSVKGIYHFSEPALLTKYDMAVAMAESMGLTSEHIKADTSEPASDATPRPYDCQMDTSKLTTQGFHINTSDFKTAIKEILS